MNPGPARLRFADQMGADGQERRHRVVDFDHGQALRPLHVRPSVEVGPDDRGRGGRAPQQLDESLALDERDVARARLADRPRRADRDAAVAHQATPNQCRELFHRCDHGRFPFFLERRRRGPGRRGRAGLRSTSPVWPESNRCGPESPDDLAAFPADANANPCRLGGQAESLARPSTTLVGPISTRSMRGDPRCGRSSDIAARTSRLDELHLDQGRQVRHMR